MAIGEIGRLPKNAPRAAGFVVTHDAVVRDVADQDIAAVAEPHRSLRPAHSAGQLFDAAAEQTVFGKARIENLDGSVAITLVRPELERLRARACWQRHRGRRSAG